MLRFFIAVCLFLAAPLQALAASAVHDRQTHHMFEVIKPAVVMIEGLQTAHVKVQDTTLPQDKLAYIFQKVRAEIREGLITTKQQAVEATLQEVIDHPFDYLVPTDQTEDFDAKVGGYGSGFIATPDGYIVTNAHVVAPADETIKEQAANQGLREIVTHDMQKALAAFEQQGIPISDDMRNKLIDVDLRVDRANMHIENIQRRAYVFTAVADDHEHVNAIPAEITSAVGAPIPGKDVAVIKVDQRNLPTAPLGDDTQMDIGDKLFVVGYPGAVSFHPLLSMSTLLDPTFTAGIVSARKEMKEGWSVIQTDAESNHGNSGGPAVDASGHVIGILTFGAVDVTHPDREVANINYIVPTTIVREFLQRAGANMVPGVFTPLYERAVTAYDNQHYGKALELFQELDRIHPNHTYITRYISDAQSEIAAGHDRPEIPWVLIATIASLASAAVVVFIVLARRRAPAAA